MNFLQRCAESLIELENKKEVKKVKKEIDFNKIPYFELKVVKVKKEKREKCVHFMLTYVNELDRYKCNKCGVIGFWDNRGFTVSKPKANIVNGENINKIKFPCLCSYNEDCYGMITKTKANECYDNEFYTLHTIDKQYNSFSSVRSYYNLKDLIEVWNIHIRKGKIIIFEEVI